MNGSTGLGRVMPPNSESGSFDSVSCEKPAGRVLFTCAPCVSPSPRRYSVKVLPRCAPRGCMSRIAGAACSVAAARRSDKHFIRILFLRHHRFFQRNGNEILFQFSAEVIDPHSPVEARRDQMPAIGMELQRIDSAAMAAAHAGRVPRLGLIDMNIAGRAAD